MCMHMCIYILYHSPCRPHYYHYYHYHHHEPPFWTPTTDPPSFLTPTTAVYPTRIARSSPRY